MLDLHGVLGCLPERPSSTLNTPLPDIKSSAQRHTALQPLSLNRICNLDDPCATPVAADSRGDTGPCLAARLNPGRCAYSCHAQKRSGSPNCVSVGSSVANHQADKTTLDAEEPATTADLLPLCRASIPLAMRSALPACVPGFASRHCHAARGIELRLLSLRRSVVDSAIGEDHHAYMSGGR